MGSGSSAGGAYKVKPEQGGATSSTSSDDHSKVTFGKSRHSISMVRQNLLDTGLTEKEVETALNSVAREATDMKLSTEVTANELKTVSHEELVDSAEILNVIENLRGKAPGAIPALVGQGDTISGFSTWVERCEALLEEECEADYLAKKQLAAQVRAYLANTASAEQREQELLRQRHEPRDEISDEEMSGGEDATEDLDGLVEEALRAKSKESGEKRVTKLKFTANQLFTKLLKGGKNHLPNSYVRNLLRAFTDGWIAKYSRASVITDVTVPSDGKLIVVGDTHGQLQDVLTIFLNHGPPSAKNRYVFNGDIADRGSSASEIFCLLFAYFLEEPTSVIMTRGNHEDNEMNMMPAEDGGGFYNEVRGKHSTSMFELSATSCLCCMAACRGMPRAT